MLAMAGVQQAARRHKNPTFAGIHL